MKPILAATQDCFSAIRQLRHLDAHTLAAPELLHTRLKGFVDEMQRRLQAAEFGHEDVQDITYALVALADEAALNAGDSLAGYWMTNLLQFHYFQENTAGDGFFTRLEQVRRDSRRLDVLRVYVFCLALGFQGRYRIRGGELELMNLTETLQRELGPGKINVELLSPDGERPPDALTAAGGPPLLFIAAGVLLAALLVFVGLRLTLASSVSSLERDMAGQQRP